MADNLPWGVTGPNKIGGGTPGNVDYDAIIFHSRDLLENLKPQLFMTAYCQTRNIGANQGNTIQWRRPTPFVPTWINNADAFFADPDTPLIGLLPSLQPLGKDSDGNSDSADDAFLLTEGITPGMGYFNMEEVLASTSQYGEYRKYTDQTVKVAIDPIVQIMVQEQAPEAAMVIELLVQNALVNAGNVVIKGAGTRAGMLAGDGITYDDVKTVALALRESWVPKVTSWVSPNAGQQTVPGRPAYVGFLTPAGVDYMRANVTEWKDAETYREGNFLLPGEVGMTGDVRWIEEPLGLHYWNGASGTGVRVEVTPIMGMDALARTTITPGGNFRAMIMPSDTPRESDELGQRGSVGWKLDFVATILEEARVHVIEWTTET